MTNPANPLPKEPVALKLLRAPYLPTCLVLKRGCGRSYASQSRFLSALLRLVSVEAPRVWVALPIKHVPKENKTDDREKHPLGESRNTNTARIVPKVSDCRDYEND